MSAFPEWRTAATAADVPQRSVDAVVAALQEQDIGERQHRERESVCLDVLMG